jgi:solute carrier family 45 protein 1/2/4
MKSDKSRNRYGRRRPYMLAGTLAVVVCYLVLGWTKEIVGLFVQDAEMVGLMWAV